MEVEREREREKGDDTKEGNVVKEKFKMVIQRMASERRVETQDQCLLEAAKFTRVVDPKKWKKITEVLCEIGLLIMERKATWHNSCKESQKREEDILEKAEELRTQEAKMTGT